MRLIGLLIVGILIASCSNEHSKHESTYLKDDIARLLDRIVFIQSSLLKIKETEPDSRRNKYLLKEAKWLGEVFDELERKLKKGESVDKQLKNIRESIRMTSQMMDMNINEIDDVIQNKLLMHFNELEILNLTISTFDSNEEITHSLRGIQEGFLNTFLTTSRTDKYTFEKAEPFAFPINPNGSRVSESDSLKVFIGHFAYDSTTMPNIVYWIDDTLLNESNALESDWHHIWVGGNKGKHTVRGRIQNFPNNREDYSYWEFDYIVE